MTMETHMSTIEDYQAIIKEFEQEIEKVVGVIFSCPSCSSSTEIRIDNDGFSSIPVCECRLHMHMIGIYIESTKVNLKTMGSLIDIGKKHYIAVISGSMESIDDIFNPKEVIIDPKVMESRTMTNMTSMIKDCN